MATDTLQTFHHFLRSQVWRSNYLLIEEGTPDRTRFPHERKLEHLHSLCIHNGYRTASDCEQIRRRLYTREQDAACPPQLLLAIAYLPDQVISLPEPVDRSLETSLIDRLRPASALPHQQSHYRLSSLSWGQRRYWLHLPEDIHSLLIDRDCALLAA